MLRCFMRLCCVEESFYVVMCDVVPLHCTLHHSRNNVFYNVITLRHMTWLFYVTDSWCNAILMWLHCDMLHLHVTFLLYVTDSWCKFAIMMWLHRYMAMLRLRCTLQTSGVTRQDGHAVSEGQCGGQHSDQDAAVRSINDRIRRLQDHSREVSRRSQRRKPYVTHYWTTQV